MNRQTALALVRQYSFMLDDVRLFLDVSPHNRQALACYKKYRALYNEAVKNYEQNYGPLTANAAADCDKWSWIDQPWPWEKEAN